MRQSPAEAWWRHTALHFHCSRAEMSRTPGGVCVCVCFRCRWRKWKWLGLNKRVKRSSGPVQQSGFSLPSAPSPFKLTQLLRFNKLSSDTLTGKIYHHQSDWSAGSSDLWLISPDRSPQSWQVLSLSPKHKQSWSHGYYCLRQVILFSCFWVN